MTRRLRGAVIVRRIAALLLLIAIASSSLEGLWSIEAPFGPAPATGTAVSTQTLDGYAAANADAPTPADDPCPCLCDCSCPGAQLVVASAPLAFEFGVGAVLPRPAEDDRSDPLLDPRPHDRPPLG